MSQTESACSLSTDDLKQRLDWISELRQRFLLNASRLDLTLEMRFSGQAAAEVDELVRLEQECCSFLTFRTRFTTRGVLLTITAPESARFASPNSLTILRPRKPDDGSRAGVSAPHRLAKPLTGE